MNLRFYSPTFAIVMLFSSAEGQRNCRNQLRAHRWAQSLSRSPGHAARPFFFVFKRCPDIDTRRGINAALRVTGRDHARAIFRDQARNIEPALPKPCTATRAPFKPIRAPCMLPAKRTVRRAPWLRGVSCEPPSDNGLPVTDAQFSWPPHHRDRIHDPGHRLRIGVDVGRGMSRFRAD